MKYSDKFKDPRWQKKRLEILQRDEFACQICFDTESTLNIHHRRYLQGKEPWEYPNKFLVTLCESCHQFESEIHESSMNDLINILKEKFYSSDLDILTDGFKNLSIVYTSQVTSEIISFMLSSPDIMEKSEKMFFEYLHKKNQENGKN